MTKDIDFMRKILIDKFGDMPLWVRVTTYLVVLVVSIYILLRPNFLYGIVVASNGEYEKPFRDGSVEVIYDSQGVEFQINERGLFAIPLFSKIPQDLELRFNVDGERYPVKIGAMNVLFPRRIKIFVEPGEPPRFRLASPETVTAGLFDFPGFGGTALAQPASQAPSPAQRRAEPSVDAIIHEVTQDGRDGAFPQLQANAELSGNAISRSLIVGAIEDAYGIAIPAHDWQRLRTVADIEAYVANAGFDLRVRKILRDATHLDCLYVAPTIPAKKLANAREQTEVPADETVIGLLDATFFGSAKQAIVFGRRGIYYRTSWTRESGSPRVGALAYRDFPGRSFEKAGFLEISLGAGLRFVVAGSCAGVDELTALLTEIEEARSETAR